MFCYGLNVSNVMALSTYNWETHHGKKKRHLLASLPYRCNEYIQSEKDQIIMHMIYIEICTEKCKNLHWQELKNNIINS